MRRSCCWEFYFSDRVKTLSVFFSSLNGSCSRGNDDAQYVLTCKTEKVKNTVQLQILSLNFKTQGAHQLQRKNAPSLIIKEMSRCRPNYFRVGFGFNLQLFYFQRGYHIIFFGGLPPLCVSCQRSMGGTALFWHHHQWQGPSSWCGTEMGRWRLLIFDKSSLRTTFYQGLLKNGPRSISRTITPSF